MVKEEDTYDPGMAPIAEKALVSARTTARLDGGRGNELLTQAKRTTQAAYDCAMRNLLKRSMLACCVMEVVKCLQRYVSRSGVHGGCGYYKPDDTNGYGYCDMVEPLAGRV